MYFFLSMKMVSWGVQKAELVDCVNASAHFYTIVGQIKYDLFIF